MQAFHSFWSKPNCVKNDGRIVMPAYEMLVLVLSALKWKQINGPVKMITDSAGADFFAANGLENLWSEPIDTSLDSLGDDIDPFLFWAAGKLYALRKMPCPCVILDTDMIIWQDISNLFQQDVIAAHAESLSNPVYPDPNGFCMKTGYSFPDEWDFSVKPVNTAFLYMPDSDLRDYYVASAFAFMASLEPSGVDPVISMCFAEQRILPMCVGTKKRRITYLLDDQDLYHQQIATHLWGHKKVLSETPRERDLFCVKCIKRILLEFPEWEDWLSQNAQMHRYLAKYKSTLIRKLGYYKRKED